jgi:2',3'-cyclic-nucleotide 2'-phosphodiesterase/3'-nucleotidase
LAQWLAILFFALTLGAQEAREVRVQVLMTADLHGHVLPQDSYTLQPANHGWAKLATLIRGLRTANPNTVAVDCGDATQGEPINYVWSRLNSTLPEPSMAIMNSLGYSAMVVGGQELDHGLAQVRAMEDQAQFPWLAANVAFAADGRLAFTPYVKLDLGGVQVAVLGLAGVSPGGTSLGPSAGMSVSDGLIFQDPITVARAIIPQLREKEKVDMVVVALHGGAGKSSCPGGEDATAVCLATQVPGIDLILAGRSRQQMTTEANGVPILQAGFGGQALAQAEFVFQSRRRGRWELVSRQARILQPSADTPPDPQVMDLTAPLRAAVETYLNTFATNLATDLDGRWARMEDTAVMNLLHTVAHQATGAQVTALPTPGSRLFIPKGVTSVRQFYALFPNDQRIARIRVTGRQLRAYLENAARFYNFSHNPDLFNRSVAPEDFDTLDGCSYALDISRPVGQRVVELTFQDQPVKDDQEFTLGLPTSRLAGSGGYLEAMGWTGKPDFVSAEPFRNLVLDYVLSRPTLAPAPGDTWRIIPSLDRERVLAQQP